MKYLIALFAVLLLTSCSSDLPPDPASPGVSTGGMYYRAIQGYDDWATDPVTLLVKNDRVRPDLSEKLEISIEDFYVYEYYYIWNEAQQSWVREKWPGDSTKGWIVNDVINTQVELSSEYFDDAHEAYLIAYTCRKDGVKWNCNNNKWQMQIIGKSYYCMDSDEGDSKGQIFGITTLNSTQKSQSFKDKCESSKQLQEYYCDNYKINSRIIDCDYGCYDGVCLSSGDVPNLPSSPGLSNEYIIKQYPIDSSADSYKKDWSSNGALGSPDMGNKWVREKSWCKENKDEESTLMLEFEEEVIPSEINIYFSKPLEKEEVAVSGLFLSNEVETETLLNSLIKKSESSEYFKKNVFSIDVDTESSFKKVNIKIPAGYWGCIDSASLEGKSSKDSVVVYPNDPITIGTINISTSPGPTQTPDDPDPVGGTGSNTGTPDDPDPVGVDSEYVADCLGDGIMNCGDSNEDGTADFIDSNADSIIDVWDIDFDGNFESYDTNFDGVADAFDYDSTGFIEAYDLDFDGILDSWDTDEDGTLDATDTDGDGVADAFDTDGNGIIGDEVSCTPKTCSELNYECGVVSDGCGTNLQCGSCGSSETCSSGACQSSGMEDIQEPPSDWKS